MTPLCLHQIWLQGHHVIPSKYDAARQSWKTLHPHWTFKVWDEMQLANLAKGTRWELAISLTKSLIQRADVYRCVILENEGGVYADMDMMALRPLDDLLDSRILVGKTSMTHWPFFSSFMKLNNGLLASPAHHPFWSSELLPVLLVALQSHTLLDDMSSVWHVLRSTGPGLWSSMYTSQSLHIVPYHLFYSLSVHKKQHVKEGDIQQLLQEGCYTYHMQDSAWIIGWEKTVLSAFIGSAWKISVPTLLCLVCCFLLLLKRNK